MSSCSVCQSNDFYYDKIGSKICSICHTQLKEYIEEEFNFYDIIQNKLNIKVNKIKLNKRRVKQKKLNKYKIKRIKKDNRLRTVMIRHKVHKVQFIRKYTKDKTKLSEVTTYDILLIYQYCLKLLAIHIIKLFNIQSSDLLLDYIFNIWKQYLLYLKACNINIFIYIPMMRNDILRQKRQYELNKEINSEDLLIPSRVLLLSIIYLSIRQFRLNITINQIYHYCITGVIPYASLWSYIPKELVKKLPHKLKIFSQPMVIDGFSVDFILLNVLKLCNYIYLHDISFINTPLIARSLIIQLGLPSIVWYNYCRLSKVYRSDLTIDICKCYDNHYTENILASVIVSCKLSNNWINWLYKYKNIYKCNYNSIESNNDVNTYDYQIDSKLDNEPETPLDRLINYNMKYLNLITKISDNYNNNSTTYSCINQYMRAPMYISELDTVPRLLLPNLLQCIKNNSMSTTKSKGNFLSVGLFHKQVKYFFHQIKKYTTNCLYQHVNQSNLFKSKYQTHCYKKYKLNESIDSLSDENITFNIFNESNDYIDNQLIENIHSINFNDNSLVSNVFENNHIDIHCDIEDNIEIESYNYIDKQFNIFTDKETKKKRKTFTRYDRKINKKFNNRLDESIDSYSNNRKRKRVITLLDPIVKLIKENIKYNESNEIDQLDNYIHPIDILYNYLTNDSDNYLYNHCNYSADISMSPIYQSNHPFSNQSDHLSKLLYNKSNINMNKHLSYYMTSADHGADRYHSFNHPIYLLLFTRCCDNFCIDRHANIHKLVNQIDSHILNCASRDIITRNNTLVATRCVDKFNIYSNTSFKKISNINIGSTRKVLDFLYPCTLNKNNDLLDKHNRYDNIMLDEIVNQSNDKITSDITDNMVNIYINNFLLKIIGNLNVCRELDTVYNHTDELKKHLVKKFPSILEDRNHFKIDVENDDNNQDNDSIYSDNYSDDIKDDENDKGDKNQSDDDNNNSDISSDESDELSDDD